MANVGIVIVSHSPKVAEGASEMVRQMVGDTVPVAYTGGTAIGVVVYRIEKGPRLTGQWTVLGADGDLYRETLTKIGLAAGGSDDATVGGELDDGDSVEGPPR